MNSANIKWITRSALGIALVLLFQLLGKVIPGAAGAFSPAQLITGSLVNCVLLVFCFSAGIWSGVVIAVVSPILALLTGTGPALPVLAPVIACGNLLLVITAWLCGKRHKALDTIGCVVSAAVKCAFLWAVTPLVLSAVGAPDKQASAIRVMLSWPQGVTALLGAFLALAVLHRLRHTNAE